MEKDREKETLYLGGFHLSWVFSWAWMFYAHLDLFINVNFFFITPSMIAEHTNNSNSNCCNDDEFKLLPIGFHEIWLLSQSVHLLIYSMKITVKKIPTEWIMSSVLTQILSSLNVSDMSTCVCTAIHMHAVAKISEKCEADTSNLYPMTKKIL